MTSGGDDDDNRSRLPGCAVESFENWTLANRQSSPSSSIKMFTKLEFDLDKYATVYTTTRDTYLSAAKALKLATGPYKASRDAYVAATATYTKSLYE